MEKAFLLMYKQNPICLPMMYGSWMMSLLNWLLCDTCHSFDHHSMLVAAAAKAAAALDVVVVVYAMLMVIPMTCFYMNSITADNQLGHLSMTSFAVKY